MARQQRDFHVQLDDAEKLRLYAQSSVSKYQSLNASLAKAGEEKTVGAEKERDEAKNEAQVARLAAVTTGDAKARAEEVLARVQEALAVVEEARHK